MSLLFFVWLNEPRITVKLVKVWQRLVNFRFSVATCSFILALLPSMTIASLWNVFIEGFVFVPCGGNFFYIFFCLRAGHHTSGVTSGNIQCAYSVKENSPRGLLVTPRANSIPPKYINLFYEFSLTRHEHDVWIAVPESCSTAELVELNCFANFKGLIQTAVLLPCFCRT